MCKLYYYYYYNIYDIRLYGVYAISIDIDSFEDRN